MAHFKFLLDRSVEHLAGRFPPKRVATLASFGLPNTATDVEVIEAASAENCLLVVSNRRDFLPAVRNFVAGSTKKRDGCKKVSGLIVLIPNEEHVQARLLKGLEQKLSFEGRKVSFTDVHDLDLLVQVESNGVVRVSRMPRCPHCDYKDRPQG